MNGLSVLEWVVLACIVLSLSFWGSPLGWPRAFIAWRRSRSPASLREATSAAADVAGEMEAMAQPTLLLIPTSAPGFSKLGGEPELPEGTRWPMGSEGPPSLLIQLDLGGVRASDGPAWLPESGRLYAFLDEGRIGCADQVRIIYSAGRTGPMAAAPPTEARKPSFPERRVAFKRFMTAPSLEWLGVDARRLRGADRAVWQSVASLVDAPDPDVIQFRVGGYPNEIQDGRMPLECEHLARDLPPPVWGAHVEPGIARASQSWRLLMQIDSDPALKMNWGDGGRLYVFIREEHARAAEFSKTVTLFQCY